MIQTSPAPNIAVAICRRTAAATTALDNASSYLAILHAGIDALPAESALADGIGLTLDCLAGELTRAKEALA